MRKQTKIAAMVSAAALLTMGAAMTSLAAGWSQEGDDWVYLDRYGDKVTNEWKKSPADGNWYYLGDDGYMVTSQLLTDTGSTNDTYYVNSGGRKVTNAWVSVDNTDGFVLPNGDEPSTVYYYFGSDGKAVKGSGGEYKSKKLKKSNDSTEQKYFLFDDQGHMMSGWVHKGGVTGDEDLYYLGTEDEGWARTGFVYLEDEEDVELDPYETEHWYWFSDTGKCVAADTTKYINGQYYYFGEGRYMEDGWFYFTSEPDSPANLENAGVTTGTGRLATGWVKRAEDGSDDEYWYYRINVRGDDGKVRATVPFNRNGAGKAKDATFVNEKGETETWTDDKVYAARSIDNKIYLFDYYGHMITGIVTNPEKTGVASDVEGFDGAWVYNSSGNVMQDPNVSGVGNWYYLDPKNVYYFNNVAGSSEGQMAKNGRVTVNADGETFYYHFKTDGSAYTNEIVSGVLYGHDGKRIQSDAGWMAVTLTEPVNYEAGGIKYKVTGVVAVNSSGRVRTTDKSTVRIDGENFEVGFAPDLSIEELKKTAPNDYFVLDKNGKVVQKTGSRVPITASVK